MKKYFALTLFLILSLAGRQPALADNQEDSYPWVLAGILNQISPKLGESKAMEMLVPCAAMLIGTLEKSGIKDEDKRENFNSIDIKIWAGNAAYHRLGFHDCRVHD